MNKTKELLDKIKVLQEECKLVAMVVGTVGSVAAFLNKLMTGKLFFEKAAEVVKAAEPIKEAVRGSAKVMPSAASDAMAALPNATLQETSNLTIDTWTVVLGVIVLVFIALAGYYLIKVLHKHMSKPVSGVPKNA